MTETKALLIILAVFIAIPIITFFSAWLTAMMAFDVKQKEEEQNTEEDNYTKPQFKELTEEQIADIHSRGKITPEEVIEE